MAVLAEEKAVYIVNEPDDVTEVSYKNPVRELGFAQIEHIIGLDTDLSDGAYRTLAILHYFWQQKKRAYPSLATLATLRGKDEKTVRRHLAELTDKGIISRQFRMGTSSVTWLEDLPQEYQDAASDILTLRKIKKDKNAHPSQKCPGGVSKMSRGGVKNVQQRITTKEEQVVEATTPIVGTDQPSPAEKKVEQLIFGLGWKDRMEIREMAEKDVGMVSLTQALQEFKEKVASGEYRANFPTFRKFWNNVLSTNALRAPAVIEMPEYQRNIKWAT
jgi:hypothetical protein